jgi:hypothetical protein
MKRLIGLILVGLVLAGCGTSVRAGTVVDKHYSPARDWTTQEPTYIYVPVQRTRMSCYTVNKQQRCSTQWYTDMQYTFVGWHTEAHHSDQKWTVTLRDKEGNTGEVQVSQPQFSELSNGSFYDSENK